MAGRAGRRGVDTTGTVVIYCDCNVFLKSNLYFHFRDIKSSINGLNERSYAK